MIIVTGGNRGIGGALVRELEQRGVRDVIVACRDSTTHPLDLLSQRSITAFAERLAGQKVELLVNNAGAMFANRQLTDDGFERTLAVNCLGPLRLTELLAPKRVLNVVTIPFGKLDLADLHSERRFGTFGTYLATKLAFMHVARVWASRGMNVQNLMPGMVRTPMLDGPGLDSAFMRAITPLMYLFAARPETIGTNLADIVTSNPETDAIWSRARRVSWAKKLRDPARNSEVYETLRRAL
jgi:NAD(P)-dependent dehydrogenase (short-subunit alcohol dehydrogenase family)